MTSVTSYITEDIKAKNTLLSPIRTKRLLWSGLPSWLQNKLFFTLRYAPGIEDVLRRSIELRLWQFCSRYCVQEPSRKPSLHDTERNAEISENCPFHSRFYMSSVTKLGTKLNPKLHLTMHSHRDTHRPDFWDHWDLFPAESIS